MSPDAGNYPRCADGPPRREWLWPTGHRHAQQFAPEAAPDYHPAGAWWWRFAGETPWRPVPGRDGWYSDLPEGEVMA